jgi:hypothetical protein
VARHRVVGATADKLSTTVHKHRQAGSALLAGVVTAWVVAAAGAMLSAALAGGSPARNRAAGRPGRARPAAESEPREAGWHGRHRGTGQQTRRGHQPRHLRADAPLASAH